MAALFGFVGQDMPLDDCSVTADLKLALAFQGPHPGIFVLGQKQPLIVRPARPTYHPAFVPPVPAAPEPPKAVLQVDVSDITAGSAVVHKAFGAGVVQSIDKGLITVSFGGLEKKFQFPGAFQQGFLRKA